MNRVVGGALQIMAAVLFVAAGSAEEVALLIPAAVSGMAGLWAWGRRGASPLPLPADPNAQLAERLARMEQVLAASQEELGKLAEDREFYQQLYAAQRERQVLK